MSSSINQTVFTRDGCLLGMRLILPLVPGIVAFGTAFGAAALQKGMTFWETVGMSAIVYSGVAQMVALELWSQSWSWGAVLAVVLVSATVSARMVLMGAALQPWLSGSPRGQTILNLFVLTDANWLIAMRYRSEGGRDAGIIAGAGLLLWVVWALSAVPGYVAGALVGDPKRLGFDLILPLYFVAMLIPLWRGRRQAAPWLVAALVALAVAALVPGYTCIVAGALAGALAGAMIPDRQP